MLGEVGIRIKFDIVDLSQFVTFRRPPTRGDIMMVRWGGRPDPLQAFQEGPAPAARQSRGRGRAGDRCVDRKGARLDPADPDAHEVLQRLQRVTTEAGVAFRPDDAIQGLCLQAKLHQRHPALPANGQRPHQRHADRGQLQVAAPRMNSIVYIGRRVISTMPMLVLVGLITFLLIHLTPGDPAAVVAGENASAAAIEEARHRLGLDQPFLLQFWHWLVKVVGGDLGTSFTSGRPVTELILDRMPITLSLTTGATLIGLVIAVPLGVFAATQRGSWLDRTTILITSLGDRCT